MGHSWNARDRIVSYSFDHAIHRIYRPFHRFRPARSTARRPSNVRTPARHVHGLRWDSADPGNIRYGVVGEGEGLRACAVTDRAYRVDSRSCRGGLRRVLSTVIVWQPFLGLRRDGSFA